MKSERKKLPSALIYYLIVIFISLAPLLKVLFNPDLSHTHDGLMHLARMAAFFKAFSDGQIPVRFAGDLNFGYGMPLFNFIYHTPYFISSFFLFFGLGLINTFKVVLALSFILSGIFMFAFSRSFFESNKKALLITLFYQFAPFRLVEVIDRGSFGEVYAYAFLPLVLFGLTKLFKTGNYFSFFLTAIAVSLLVISHNSISLVFFGISFGFIIFFASEKRDYLLGFLSLLVGLMFSAYYWMPALLEHKYTYGDLLMKDLYLSHFPPIQNFLIPNLLNSSSLKIGAISVQFGLFHVLAIILAIILLFRKNLDYKLKRLIISCLALILISLFFMQEISKPFWENISFLRQFQFSWRLLAVVSFATALLSVSFLEFSFFKRKFVYVLLLFLVVLSTIFYWSPTEGFLKVNEKDYWNYPLNTTFYGETDVIWSAGPAKSYPKERILLIGGKAIVSNFSKKSNSQSFKVNALTNAQFVDNTQYFPGWKIYVDGKETLVEFQDQNWRGLMVFWTAPGEHEIKAVFEETKLRLVADLVSISSFVFLFSIFAYKLREKV